MKKVFVVLCFFCMLGLVSASAYGGTIVEQNYEISRSKVDRVMVRGNIFPDFIEVTNTGEGPLRLTFSAKGTASEFITFKSSSLTVEPKNASQWNFNIQAKRTGNFSGTIEISGDIVRNIPVQLVVTNTSLDPLYLIDVSLRAAVFNLNKEVDVKIDLTKLKPVQLDNLSLTYNFINPNNETVFLESENLTLDGSKQLLKEFTFPPESPQGFYVLQVISVHNGEKIVSESLLEARIAFANRKLFGFIPYWTIMAFVGFLLLGLITFYLIRRHILSKRKYKMTLDMKTLPKADKKFLWLGKIAEKKDGAYLDPHKLTTHAIVAGATGGGKSIAAQVLIEEALKQNIGVLVFDPTAQWSGMLRKCTDKKMFAYYSKFGMKTTDARGFPGNIRAVKDPRQIIEVEKYFEPGHIQIFTLNKLQPKDMDIFVANVIRGIFESDPKEYPTLRILLVFDEVHRLLPKFGGSGEGFVQIERSCREFRKWGYGVMLVSQVLSDFVGEIKANISTEVQMRTRDEGDLNRIKTKFGDEFLQSLVKASVGVGMFVNPSYNHANPYFVNFRPILHNTRRLPDEELEKYNQYNDVVEDLEYQIEQLEELKIDVFDLKMEVKLVKDKIMVGNFSVVDIYLEGLKPRIVKQWEKLGKTPKKKQIKLANLDEIKKSVAEAQAESQKAKAKAAAAEAAANVKKVDPMEELNNRLLNPLTLDNGMMISSLKELKEVLPNIEDDIWKIHVNEQKNDIANWFQQLSKTVGARLKSITDKAEMIKEVNAFKGEKTLAPPPKPATKQNLAKPTTAQPTVPQASAKPASPTSVSAKSIAQPVTKNPTLQNSPATASAKPAEATAALNQPVKPALKSAAPEVKKEEPVNAGTTTLAKAKPAASSNEPTLANKAKPAASSNEPTPAKLASGEATKPTSGAEKTSS